ncbi:hypothetical protein T07_4376 [Trichinella nelsoni]|uniref:Uncharacterized protein n=1 Tax=Trichinella nelsoni TaxID=6336 RepID=A0A0V0RGF2_9BILA|nr:hypothetical protein T07_4376 [Trichinella nelsoni]
MRYFLGGRSFIAMQLTVSQTDHLALSCPIGISVSLTVIGPNTFSTFNVPAHNFFKTVVVFPDVPDEYPTGADANILTVPG